MSKPNRRSPRHRHWVKAPDPIPMKKRIGAVRHWIVTNTKIDLPRHGLSPNVLADILLAHYPFGRDVPRAAAIHVASGELLTSRFRKKTEDGKIKPHHKKDPVYTTVYVIGAKARTHVKIGRTQTPERRFKALQTAFPEPLYVFKVFQAVEPAYEKELHDRFQAHHTHGEWFKVQGDLTDWLNSFGPPVPINDWNPSTA